MGYTRILRRLAWALAGYLVIVTVLFIAIQVDRISLNHEKLLETKSCPYCYGTSLCDELLFKHDGRDRDYDLVFEDEFDLTRSYWLERLFLFNIKNVFFLRDNYSQRRFVLKKLAHDDELADFDRTRLACSPDSVVCSAQNLPDLSKRLEASELRALGQNLEIEVLTCFSDRLADRLYENLGELGSLQANLASNSSRRNFSLANTMLLTTLKINPEPIVLQLFKSSDGWPFPEYVGSCGRVMVESNEGATLKSYINHSFLERVGIASRLLEALQTLTRNPLDCSIYLFDLTLENVAYNESKQRVYFIDVENVLLVDQRLDTPNALHEFEFEDCGVRVGCLTYSVHELCDSKISDLNYYSVCRHILSSYAPGGGLLHSIPPEVDSQFNLTGSLDECARMASPAKRGRFQMAAEIAEIFTAILYAHSR